VYVFGEHFQLQVEAAEEPVVGGADAIMKALAAKANKESEDGGVSGLPEELVSGKTTFASDTGLGIALPVLSHPVQFQASPGEAHVASIQATTMQLATAYQGEHHLASFVICSP
jgi:hypothetical protein